MGVRGTGDGGERPSEGDRPPEEPAEPAELSGLPPEWGRIVIPSDASALAAEAEQVRRELAAERRRSPRPPLVGRHPAGVPLLIMFAAMLITLVSLFAMAWSGANPPARSLPEPTPMPALTLSGTDGHAAALHSLGPAAILLVEDCECDHLIAETATAAPAGVAVVVVDRAPPTGSRPEGVRWLLDPDSALRGALGLSPPTGAAAGVVLLDREQNVTLVTRAVSASAFRTALVTL